jgi:hypothetical protein
MSYRERVREVIRLLRLRAIVRAAPKRNGDKRR